MLETSLLEASRSNHTSLAIILAQDPAFRGSAAVFLLFRVSLPDKATPLTGLVGFFGKTNVERRAR